jgi:hypothetical protein
VRFTLLLSAAFAAACSSNPRTGGPCEYKPFAGQCALDGAPAVEGPAEGGGVIVRASYLLPTDGARRWELRWKIDQARAQALLDHVKAHAPAPCRGEYQVSGSCKPWTAIVDVPPFAGAEAR